MTYAACRSFVLLIVFLGYSSALVSQSSDSLYTQRYAEFQELNRRFSNQELDSLLDDSRDLMQKVQAEKEHFQPFDYGVLAANIALVQGHVFNTLGLYDSATVYFFQSADYFARYTQYNGYFTAMANALQPLLNEKNYDEYLEQLDYHFKKANDHDPDLEDLYIAVYLRFKLAAQQNHGEKLQTIEALDSIFDNKLYNVQGLLQFRFYTDVLEYAHEEGYPKLIERFMPKYVEELGVRGLPEGVDYWYRGYFALLEENYEDAVRWLTKALESELAEDLIIQAEKRLYTAHKMLGNWEQALRYFEAYTEANDELEVKKIKLITSDLLAGKQLEKAKVDLLNLQLENQTIRTQIFIGLFLLALFVLFLIVQINRNKLLKQRNAIQKQKMEFITREAEQLKFKMLAKIALKEKNRSITSTNNKTEQVSTKKSPFNTDEMIEENSQTDVLIEHLNLPFINMLMEIAKLSPRDCKMAAFIGAGFDNADLENIFGISPQSVRAAKTRLKKKLKLESSINLQEWLMEQYKKNGGVEE